MIEYATVATIRGADTIWSYPLGRGANGHLVYDAAGHVVFTVVPAVRRSERPDALVGFVGRYTVDPDSRTIRHSFDAESPSMAGAVEEARNYRLLGDTLDFGLDRRRFRFVRESARDTATVALRTPVFEPNVVSARLRCSPSVVGRDDTLEMTMDTPHGVYLVAYPPNTDTTRALSSEMYLIVFPGEGTPDRTRRRSLMPPDSFQRVPTLRLVPRTLTGGVWVYGRDTNELLFRAPGDYRFRVGSDMETDGPQFTECIVRYRP
jgi:hypothetical protein